MLVSKMAVDKAIDYWNLRFTEEVRGNDKLRFLADGYLEELQSENVSDKEFGFAFLEMRKGCDFFPKMKGILLAVKVHRDNVDPCEGVVMLEEVNGLNAPMTDEQVAVNKARLEILADISCNNISYAEGALRMEKLSEVVPP